MRQHVARWRLVSENCPNCSPQVATGREQGPRRTGILQHSIQQFPLTRWSKFIHSLHFPFCEKRLFSMRFIDIVAPYNIRGGSGQIEQCQAHTSIQPHFFSFFLHEVHGVEFVLCMNLGNVSTWRGWTGNQYVFRPQKQSKELKWNHRIFIPRDQSKELNMKSFVFSEHKISYWS